VLLALDELRPPFGERRRLGNRRDTDMSDSHSGVPNIKIIPPLVYLAGVVICIVASIWIPTKIVPSSLAWTLGGILIICGVVLSGSAILKFKDVGTTVLPDRAASTLVVVGPYRITPKSDVSRTGSGLSGHCNRGSIAMGTDPFLACAENHTASSNRTGGSVFGKTFWYHYMRYKEKVGRWIAGCVVDSPVAQMPDDPS
jgi:hypothetical protein